MTVLDLSALNHDDTALAVAMTSANAWLAPPGARRPTGSVRPRLVIHDEGWRLLQTPSQLRRMQSEWKLARATRTANLLIVHRFSDLATAGDTGTARRGLADGLLADCSVRIVYRQEADQLPAAADVLGLSPTQLAVVPALRRGLGLWTLGPAMSRRPAPCARRGVRLSRHRSPHPHARVGLVCWAGRQRHQRARCAVLPAAVAEGSLARKQ